MDYYGLIPHSKYNEHLIHLMSFSNWRHIGRRVFEFPNTQLFACSPHFTNSHLVNSNLCSRVCRLYQFNFSFLFFFFVFQSMCHWSQILCFILMWQFICNYNYHNFKTKMLINFVEECQVNIKLSIVFPEYYTSLTSIYFYKLKYSKIIKKKSLDLCSFMIYKDHIFIYLPSECWLSTQSACHTLC